MVASGRRVDRSIQTDARAEPARPGEGIASDALVSPRGLAFAALAAADLVYYLLRSHLPVLPVWGDVVVLALPLLPAVLGLVWLALPLRHGIALLPAAAGCALIAYLATDADYRILANFAKLAAVVLVGFWFLGWFEAVSWVVLVAAIIPFVDAFSVFSSVGPTHRIVTRHESVYTHLSFAFPVPGNDGAVRLGMPDLLFFALFLAAAERFGLRLGWTWALMTFSFAGTFAIAVAAPSLSGLPALPLLSVGFLAANADLLWRRFRQQRA